MRLTDKQFDLLCSIANKSGMDCWFCLDSNKQGDSFVYDLEERKRISLKRGLLDLLDGIRDQYEIYLTEEDYKTLLDLIIELFGRKNSNGISRNSKR